ncbi:unnamed protein product [Plutella xylostella]|uniref:(diamondback moth) hypothetical protein n=1 Tax=Plutella xylostella TaxID=51655 RepID=A0A8S4G5S8_PLUXY|nr:unnamed protein product [Plutella xylostella]
MNAVILSLLVVAALAASSSADCDACLQNICYSKSTVLKRIDTTGGLDVYRKTNTLYLQYRSSDLNVGIGLDDGKITRIPDVDYTTCRAVDQQTGRVFLGTTRGLHEYNPATDTSRFLGLQSETIMVMQHSKKLYYAKLPNGMCTVDRDYKWECIRALRNVKVEDFVVDKKDDIYYRSGSQHYRLANNSDVPEYLFTHRFAKLAVDVNGEVHTSVFTDVSKLNYESDDFEPIGSVKLVNMFELVFDGNNNLVFRDIQSSPASIMKLVPNGTC